MKLNDQEKKVLLGLIDLAVKAGGLQVAANAAYFHAKLTKDEESKIDSANDSDTIDDFVQPAADDL